MNPALTRIFANNNKIASQLAPRVRQAATVQVPAALAQLDTTPVIPTEAFDLSAARKNLPHHRFTFDALEAFFKSQHNHLLQLQNAPKTWPKTTAVALEKAHQLEVTAVAAERAAATLIKEALDRNDEIEQRMRYLHEITIHELLEENPEFTDKCNEDFEAWRFITDEELYGPPWEAE